MKKARSFFVVAMLLFPSFSLAAITDAESFAANIIEDISTALVPLVFSLAFIVFIWGVFRYFVYGATSEEDREKGKKLIIYGLIGFFVMVSVWGLVGVLVGTFGLNTVGPSIPVIQ